MHDVRERGEMKLRLYISYILYFHCLGSSVYTAPVRPIAAFVITTYSISTQREQDGSMPSEPPRCKALKTLRPEPAAIIIQERINGMGSFFHWIGHDSDCFCSTMDGTAIEVRLQVADYIFKQ
jgi:hypothetical protein